jgi:hypothetical protein
MNRNYNKYIIGIVEGHEVAILFDNLLEHRNVAKGCLSRGTIVSAGFYDVSTTDEGNISVYTFGKSESLEVESRQEDNDIVLKTLTRENLINKRT